MYLVLVTSSYVFGLSFNHFNSDVEEISLSWANQFKWWLFNDVLAQKTKTNEDLCLTIPHVQYCLRKNKFNTLKIFSEICVLNEQWFSLLYCCDLMQYTGWHGDVWTAAGVQSLRLRQDERLSQPVCLQGDLARLDGWVCFLRTARNGIAKCSS